MTNLLLAVDLAAGLASRLVSVIAALSAAQSEGRDLSDGELDAFAEVDDAARARLAAKIAAKRGVPAP